MLENLKRVILPLALLVIVGFLVMVVSQTAQVVDMASRIDPRLGTVVLWGLLAIYAGLVLVPLMRLLLMPRPLRPPEKDEGPEFERHLKRLGRRLASNRQLTGHAFDLSSRQGVEAALAVLDERAEAEIRSRAATVFLMTAISQSGRLDGLLVLVNQTQMVYQIAKIYYQRPTLRDLARLYANVAATAFIVGELEDSEVGDQLAAMTAASAGSVVGAVPGLQAVTALFVNSLVTGSASAFLTLRVGLIAKGYCDALVKPQRKTLRRGASAQALKMLSAIVSRGSKVVWNAFTAGGRKRARSALGSVRDWFRPGSEEDLTDQTGKQKS